MACVCACVLVYVCVYVCICACVRACARACASLYLELNAHRSFTALAIQISNVNVYHTGDNTSHQNEGDRLLRRHLLIGSCHGSRGGRR